MSKYIVVEGPIGVGKTTLAKKIAHSLHYELMLETFSDNPFLINFYITKLTKNIFFFTKKHN